MCRCDYNEVILHFRILYIYIYKNVRILMKINIIFRIRLNVDLIKMLYVYIVHKIVIVVRLEGLQKKR